MRTTINISDDLLRMARLRAASSHRTLASVIEDALNLALRGKLAVGKKVRIEIPVSGKGGLLPGVDLDDTASLEDRMEGRA